MKICVFIIGTNCSGKSTMAKAMMSLLGGVTTTSKYETEVKDGRFVFAGKYIEGSKFAGFDVMEFYRKYSVSTGYLRLNRKVKEPFMRKMKALCDQIGMRFYVSDAHFKELCCNGSCCGLPSTWNYSRGQWCEALQIAKKNGFVTFDDVSRDIQQLVSQFQWSRADGYNCNSSEKRAQFFGMTMADYMRWLWNNPQSGQSPYKLFEGALVPQGKDANGNLIYKYNGAKF